MEADNLYPIGNGRGEKKRGDARAVGNRPEGKKKLSKNNGGSRPVSANVHWVEDG